MDATILIVDDSPLIVDGLASILTRKGYTPIPSNGGAECLNILKTVIPDLILLDIMMEPMDGWETLEKIRENSATKDIPVLMFSAKKLSPEEAWQHSVNIDDFVSKPVNPSQLIESIERIFSRKSELMLFQLAAKEKGIDPMIIDEYAVLRKHLEVDRNLLVVLQASKRMNNSEQEIRPDDKDSIRSLEDKINTEERRVQEIRDLIEKTPASRPELKVPEVSGSKI